jgi:hypothetical protein
LNHICESKLLFFKQQRTSSRSNKKIIVQIESKLHGDSKSVSNFFVAPLQVLHIHTWICVILHGSNHLYTGSHTKCKIYYVHKKQNSRFSFFYFTLLTRLTHQKFTTYIQKKTLAAAFFYFTLLTRLIHQYILKMSQGAVVINLIVKHVRKKNHIEHISLVINLRVINVRGNNLF